MSKHALAALAMGAGLLTASCAGHGGSSALPPAGGMQPQQQQSRSGAGTTRAAAVAAAPSGWATTGTQTFKLSNATDLGAASASKTLTVRVGLQLRNAQQLQSLVKSGQVIDPSTFNSTYAPASADASAVSSYLRSKGFTNVTIEPNNLIVSGTGTVAQAQSAFDTTIHSFTQNGATVFANVSPAYVPQSLSGKAIAVLGLNDVKTFSAKPQLTSCTVEGVATPPQACLRFYDPATFQSVYDVGSVPNATNTAIAIMTEGDVSQAVSDFRLNEQKFGMPQVPVVIKQVGLASTDTAGDGEWTLDMTYSTAMAGAVKTLYLYDTTSLTDSDIALEYNKWVTQDLAPIGNSSFGGCEFGPYLDGSMLVDDEILLQGAAQGQTMFVSTGDNGGFCNNFVDTNGAPGGAPFVEYPAASPYVVAVGGTDLFSNPDGSYKGESAWEAGGGGLSQFEYSPYWEASAQPVPQQGGNFRGLPDVAMDGSIETGAELWGGSAVNGSCTPCVTGGTSLSSPLAAGSYARMQSTHGNRLGFGAVQFYRVYAANAAVLQSSAGPPPWQLIAGYHDILSGTNGPYTALPNYDYTTGLGSFDIARMNALIGH